MTTSPVLNISGFCLGVNPITQKLMFFIIHITPLLRFRPLISHICDNEVNPITTLPQVGFLVRIPPLSIVLNDPQMIIGDGLSKKMPQPHSHKKGIWFIIIPSHSCLLDVIGGMLHGISETPRGLHVGKALAPSFGAPCGALLAKSKGVHVEPGLIKPGGPGPYEHGEHAGSQF